MGQNDTFKITTDTTIIVNTHNSISIQLPKQEQEKPMIHILKSYMPLILFFMGLLLSYVVRKTQLWWTNYKLKNFIVDWINLMDIPLQKQIKVFTELANREYTIDSFSGNSIIHNSHNIHADKLKSINPIDMKVLIMDNLYGNHRKKAILLYKLSSYIDFLFSIEAEITDFITGSKKSIRELNEKWNEAILEFEQVLDGMIFEKLNDINNDPFLHRIFPIQQGWKRNESRGKRTFIRDNVTMPIYVISEEHFIKEKYMDTRPLLLMKAIDKLRVSFMELELFAGYVSQRMRHYESNYRFCGKGLALSKIRLHKMRLKIICR